MAGYIPTIGLEIHVALSTKTKMFCSCLNDSDEKHPNTNICPICMGHPGTLPTINEEAIKKLMKVGVALNCQIAEFSKFDRKSYFYPDLPKGYQISQYDLPVCHSGYLEIGNDKKIRITRIHMEEDAGRLQHASGGTLVDFNRAGTPLMELVTEPDLKSADDVRKFAQELQLILRYVGASDANMEKGEMRVEVNLSLSKTNEWGTKVEVKNINSINAAGRAVEYEIKRQSEVLGEGGKLIQETRGWDEDKGKTFSQRPKEGSADYHYFPEPDLPPMRFASDTVEDIRASLPELPQQRRQRFAGEYGLPPSDIEVLTVNKELGDDFENVISEAKVDLKSLDKQALRRFIKLTANYLINELPKLTKSSDVNLRDTQITAHSFGHFSHIVVMGGITSSSAQILLKEMFETGKDPDQIIKEKELGQVSGEDEIGTMVNKVVANNRQAVEDYKKGKEASLKFLIGMVMKESGGKANPQVVEKIIKNKLI